MGLQGLQDIPDEILHKTLAFCLLVPIEDFCLFPPYRVGGKMPEEVYPRRHAYLLLVSKRFLRIGTPLLYTSLYLWSDSQAEEIAQLLRVDSYIGEAVANLRIESRAFGKGLYSVVSACPSVKTLFLDMRNVGKLERQSWGLTEVLEDGLLNPKTLYVTGIDSCRRCDHLCGVLSGWTALAS